MATRHKLRRWILSRGRAYVYSTSLPVPVVAGAREALRIKMTRPTIGTGTIGKRLSYQELQDAYNMIIGSPETVIEKLRHVKKTLDPGYILIYGNEGAMHHQAVMRSIELLGTKVIPALKED